MKIVNARTQPQLTMRDLEIGDVFISPFWSEPKSLVFMRIWDKKLSRIRWTTLNGNPGTRGQTYSIGRDNTFAGKSVTIYPHSLLDLGNPK